MDCCADGKPVMNLAERGGSTEQSAGITNTTWGFIESLPIH